ncbi:MAG: antitoxin [Methylococcales bacterium]|nr:antitoxin [Methylococcales bacterium]
MSRLSIDLTSEQHQQIKILAAVQKKSIKEFILEKVFPIEIDREVQEAEMALKEIGGISLLELKEKYALFSTN